MSEPALRAPAVARGYAGVDYGLLTDRNQLFADAVFGVAASNRRGLKKWFEGLFVCAGGHEVERDSLDAVGRRNKRSRAGSMCRRVATRIPCAALEALTEHAVSKAPTLLFGANKSHTNQRLRQTRGR
ncbi:MAG: hypothetical protein VB934_06360, partial [Polyangiaceae bacterium]